MTAVFADHALTPEGWRRDVRVETDGAGRIVSVLSGAALAEGDARVPGALLPAPANVHSHTFQRAMAGLTESRGPDGRDSFWTWRTLMYRFLETLDPDQIEAIAAMTFVEMLEAGYAAVGEFHYLHHAPGGAPYDDPAETSARIAAAASETGIGLTHLPVLYTRGGADGRALAGGQRRFGSDRDLFVRMLEGAERALAPLLDATLGVAPHSLRAVNLEELAWAAGLRPDAPLHMHIAEQTAEVEEIVAAYGARPVEWLLANAPVNARWCLIHCTHMTAAETGALARTGAVAGLCPITESNLGDGIFNGVDYLAAGGALGIGSDSDIRISLSEELRTLEYSQRLRDRGRAMLAEAGVSNGRRLFDAATKGGAQALGRASGALAPGMWADMLALDLDALPLPGLSGDMALDAWIFAGDDRAVSDVWSAGRHVVRQGRHVARDKVAARFRNAVAGLVG
jgi:formimidoylglutamate deiminase